MDNEHTVRQMIKDIDRQLDKLRSELLQSESDAMRRDMHILLFVIFALIVSYFAFIH